VDQWTSLGIELAGSKRFTAVRPVKVSFRERKVARCHVPEPNDFGTLQTGPVRFPVIPDCKVIPDGLPRTSPPKTLTKLAKSSAPPALDHCRETIPECVHDCP
jgi:hypothetical protein